MPSWITNIKRTLSQTFLIKAQGGTGVTLKDNAGTLDVKNAADSGYAGFKAAAGELSTLKLTTGAANTYIPQSDASGNLTLVAPSSLGIYADIVRTKVFSFTEATTSPSTIFTPPANSVILRVTVVMSVAAGGSGASIAIGISGTTGRDLAATDTDLTSTDIQVGSTPYTDVGGSPAAIIATIVTGGRTFTGKVFIDYVVPG